MKYLIIVAACSVQLHPMSGCQSTVSTRSGYKSIYSGGKEHNEKFAMIFSLKKGKILKFVKKMIGTLASPEYIDLFMCECKQEMKVDRLQLIVMTSLF
ncbi:hypothetical protein BpHYR1_018809 [Brachionus plicatilis]|uniref:Uncharacterized protein n=1 Tax=Brachionus plicatilis TaxID=10195 RepID=A0A3M7SVN8_BRAPC|nr:hypothetical protein BpHYR1_018809 [Brachionus plicatilis]